MEQYEQEQEFAYVTQAKVERISKKALSTVAVLGTHTPTIGGCGDDHAIGDLIGEVQIPVVVSATRRPASDSMATSLTYSRSGAREMSRNAGHYAVAKRQAI